MVRRRRDWLMLRFGPRVPVASRYGIWKCDACGVTEEEVPEIRRRRCPNELCEWYWREASSCKACRDDGRYCWACQGRNQDMIVCARDSGSRIRNMPNAAVNAAIA